MIKDLLNEIVSHGDRGAVVPISRINDLKQDMYDLQNGEYHTGYVDWMAGNADKFIPAGLDFEPRSVISVVRPDPKVILRFTYGGKPVNCIVPPLYTNEDAKGEEVLRYISNYVKPLGYTVAGAGSLPQKLLAVHCGLGLYGRNNIFYSNEFGSYAQLLSYISDMPCDESESEWYPLGRMAECENCHMCVTACPTGAIDENRHIINAEICLTSMNENFGEFPEWLDRSAHNAVIGCMKCQDCCPCNAHNENNIVEGATFTEEETMELLNHTGDDEYSDGLISKVESAGLSGWSVWKHRLPRNLAVLLHR